MYKCGTSCCCQECPTGQQRDGFLISVLAIMKLVYRRRNTSLKGQKLEMVFCPFYHVYRVGKGDLGSDFFWWGGGGSNRKFVEIGLISCRSAYSPCMFIFFKLILRASIGDDFVNIKPTWNPCCLCVRAFSRYDWIPLGILRLRYSQNLHKEQRKYADTIPHDFKRTGKYIKNSNGEL